MKLNLRLSYSVTFQAFDAEIWKQRVAVWRRPHDHLGGDIAASAWLIYDDELLTEAFRQPLRDHPCTGVERATRWIAEEQVHWPRRIRLSPGDAHHAQR